VLKKIIPIVVLGVALFGFVRPVARPGLAAPSSVTFTVNSTLDKIDDNAGDGDCHTASGTCTLRAAVMEADMASGAGATIIVPAGIYTLTIPADVADGANNGDLNLTTPASADPLISIVGAGASSTIIDANQNDRVLSVDANRTAAISGLTLRGGFAASAEDGGGIRNFGTLILSNSTVSGNQATPDGAGGGIVNYNTLTVTNSTIGPNNASNWGAGIDNAGTLTVDRSTVYGNSANFGGGIYNSSNLTLINSTLSQNSAVKDGGGLYNFYIANVYNTTIVFNSADTGRDGSGSAGGVYSTSSSTFNLRNTLLAGNDVGNAPVYDDCTGTVNSYGQNLIGEPEQELNPPCTIITGSGSWKALNSLYLLGQLQDNGGPTLTHALLTGSNAIDGGDPLGGCVDGNLIPLATDQRGFPRVVGAFCDIGAFEFGAKGPQTIAFSPLANKTFGDPSFSVSATASSGLAVTFTAAAQCNVSGSTVTLTGAGSCTVTAHQAGNSNYNAASVVPRNFTISASGSNLYLPLIVR
jgi:CSLREA domain-containing protein